ATFAHEGPARFRLRVAPGSRGAVLRVLCAGGGPRIARIWFNGSVAVDVRSYERNVNASWMEQDIFVPEQCTRGAATLSVGVKPTNGAGRPSSYRLLGFLR